LLFENTDTERKGGGEWLLLNTQFFHPRINSWNSEENGSF